MSTIEIRAGELAVVISNVAFAKKVVELEDLKKSSFDLSMSYSAWPVVDLVQAARAELGHYPKYVLAISSDGSEICHSGYAMAGAAKAAMETLCRYLALMLKPYGVRVNAIRPGFLDTASARATFGSEVIDRIQQQVGALFIEPQGVARACVAMCSGMMDSLTGQVLRVDEGWSLVSPFAYLAGSGMPDGFPDSTRDSSVSQS